MVMNRFFLFFAIILLAVGCTGSPQSYNPSEQEVNQVLDDWHDAAAEADFDRYFDHFHSDSSIFMGTDATERWTVAEFRPWAEPHFEDGEAWNFTPEQRHIYFSGNGKTAWFDEELDTPNLGPARGSGVLLLDDQEWKIAHYNLSIPIPNAIADTVIQQVEEALESTESNE